MDHAKELMIQAVSAIIFCIAVALLFRQVKNYTQLLSEVKNHYQNTEALYQSEYFGSEVTTYAQLIASLSHPLEYDLEINGVLISKYEHTTDQISEYHIANTNYRKSYFYDFNGNVTRIIYQSV